MCGRIAQGRSAQTLAPIYPGLLFADAAALPEGEELGPGQPIALVHGAGAPTLAPTRWGSSRRGRAPLCLGDDEVIAWLDPATPLADIEAILAAGGAREPGVTLVRADEARA